MRPDGDGLQERAPRSIAIVDGFAAHGGCGCCGFAGSDWSGPFAYLYETGGMRLVHLRGHTNILQRLLIHTGGVNL